MKLKKGHGYQAHVAEHKSSKDDKDKNIKHNSKRSLHKKGMFRKTESGISLIKGDCYVCKIPGHTAVNHRQHKNLNK